MAKPREQMGVVLVVVAGAFVIAETAIAFLGYPLIAAAMAAPALAMLTGSLFARIRPREGAFTERLQRQVEQGRRLAIYDHDTGLFAEWYLAMRLDEECSRAGRYSAPLSVILVAVAPSADRMTD